MPAINQLSSIVTPDELRAMLGVSVKEFKDGVVDLPVYKRSVKISCDRADARAWPLYTALADDTSTWTEKQTDFAELFRAFLAWTTARMLAIALPQFSPQEIGNGSAIMQRNDDASTTVIADIDRQIAEIIPLLVNAAEVLQPSVAAQVSTAYAFGKFGASGDPITG